MVISQSVRQLPAWEIADNVNNCLRDDSCMVITAPPGAGKSTLLPLTILDGLDSGGKVVMLEPRRLAAKQIAERMASLIGEPVGKTVGYRVRFESKVSADTRIEVLTEGILTRMLIEDSTLEGVDVVIFDEFHERSLNSDLDLALTREIQQIIRPDLKIVVMSATIDAEGICSYLGARLIESKGRMFPVDIRRCDGIQELKNMLSGDNSYRNVAEDMASVIGYAHESNEGDILAFLPGQADIMRCATLLEGRLGRTNIYPLYGQLAFAEQNKAIAPSKEGERKVVLATSIAETSLTIEGVRIVVDSGLCRKMVFNQQSGLSHLETTQISMDMATQRSGRAGRLSEGICYRLWSVATEHRMEGHRTPEILEADLMPMLLDIAAWGESDCNSLSWLTTPPHAHVSMALDALKMIGALDDGNKITRHGQSLSSVPCHPRIAQMFMLNDDPHTRALAADIAALLEEKDPMAQDVTDTDINSRIIALRKSRSTGKDTRKWDRISRIAQQYRSLFSVKENNDAPDPYKTGLLLAASYPERIASVHREGLGRYVLASGDNAYADKDDIISSYDWIAIGRVNAQGTNGRIFLASPLNKNDLTPLLRTRENISWDNKQGKVIAQKEQYIGRLVVNSLPLSNIGKDMITKVICDNAPKYGLSIFTFDDKTQNLQQRIAAVSCWHPEMEIPLSDTATVLSRAEEWLPYFIGNATTAAELKKIDMCAVIWSLLSYEHQNVVDSLAPTHVAVPTGSRIKIEYRQGAEQPILRVRLQECFGLEDTPRINNGTTPLLMELLSPGFKPVQLTQDLRSFWSSTYFEVRKELKRRYPKHYWPDNPLEAEATRGVRRN